MQRPSNILHHLVVLLSLDDSDLHTNTLLSVVTEQCADDVCDLSLVSEGKALMFSRVRILVIGESASEHREILS